jgi:hypothetical protein
MTGTTPALEFNPFLPEVHANPYPLYQRLRTQDPSTAANSASGC